MFEPKLPVIAAAVGFVLSLLVGLFSGTAFPAFFFRAIGMALFFAVVAVILKTVIQRFLPELLEDGLDTTSRGSFQDTGGVVNMTIGDEDEMPFSSLTRQEPDSEITTGSSPDGQRDDTENGMESGQFEPEEPIAVMEQVNTGGIERVEPENEKPGAATDTVQTAEKTKPKGTVSGLDILPDIQDFVPEETVVEEEAADIDVGITRESSGKGFTPPDVTTDGVETETMARAIRTILSKDN